MKIYSHVYYIDLSDGRGFGVQLNVPALGELTVIAPMLRAYKLRSAIVWRRTADGARMAGTVTADNQGVYRYDVPGLETAPGAVAAVAA